MPDRGKFFGVEGIGGAGKTTQTELLVAYLKSRGRQAIAAKEPAGVTEAEVVKRMISDWKEEGLINPEQQMVLHFAVRYFWMKGLVGPKLDLGIDVVADRTFPSTGAYHGYAEGGDLNKIENLSKKVMGSHRPDGILLLDLSAEDAKRRNAKKHEIDPYDERKMEYFRKVVEGYRTMAREGWAGVKWYVIDASVSVTEVAQQIKDAANCIIG